MFFARRHVIATQSHRPSDDPSSRVARSDVAVVVTIITFLPSAIEHAALDSTYAAGN
jgi:hypothetical protein